MNFTVSFWLRFFGYNVLFGTGYCRATARSLTVGTLALNIVPKAVVTTTIRLPFNVEWLSNWSRIVVLTTTYTYLDLVPPVPDGTLGDEISPSVLIVGSSPCTVPS